MTVQSVSVYIWPDFMIPHHIFKPGQARERSTEKAESSINIAEAYFTRELGS